MLCVKGRECLFGDNSAGGVSEVALRHEHPQPAFFSVASVQQGRVAVRRKLQGNLIFSSLGNFSSCKGFIFHFFLLKSLGLSSFYHLIPFGVFAFKIFLSPNPRDSVFSSNHDKCEQELMSAFHL